MRSSRQPSHPLLPGLLLLGLVACAHAPAGAPSPEAAPRTAPEATSISDGERKALTGSWVFAGGEAELAGADEAVERATADMGFLARPFAIQALKPRAQPRDRYTLSFEGSTVSVVSPDHPIERGEIGGPPVSITDRFGDENQTTFSMHDGALVEAGKSADGSGETVFTPGADGQTLHIRRRMESGKLSAPVDVTFSYRRQE
jgi:hypothetical protein